MTTKPLIAHKWRATFGANAQGAPGNRLTVPPQTSAPLLALKVQVLDEPAAKRHAATLTGQTELFTPEEP